VDVVEFSSLNDNRRAFERDQIDGMGATLIEVLQAKENSKQFPQIVYVPDYSNGGDVIISKNKISTVADLQGKRVAIEPGTLNLFMLYRALQINSLSLEDVTIVKLPQTEMDDAFESNKVDAVVTYPPVSISVMKHPNTKIIFSSKDIPGEVIDVIAFNKSVIEQRKNDIINFIKAFNKAVEYAKTNPDDAYKIMAEREGISPKDFRIIVNEELKILNLKEQKLIFEPKEKLINAIRAVEQVLINTGEVSQKVELSEFIDYSIIMSIEQ